MEEKFEHFRFVADRGQGPMRVDKFLVDRIVGTSRNRIQQCADNGGIVVNGKVEKCSYKIKPCDVVQVMMDYPRREFELIPEDIPLDIIYEDEDLLVVNKPAGLVVHPGHGNWTGTLVNALAWHFKESDAKFSESLSEDVSEGENEGEDDGDNFDYQKRMGLVHRIDKETSGLLVVAKNPEAGAHLSNQFLRKTTRRLYTAIVWGHVEPDEGTIVGNIGRSHRDRTMMEYFPDGSEEGKHAVTHYRVLEHLGNATVVECRLETGRTHQIRVHMKHKGHTLFNDKTYGGNQILKGTPGGSYTQFIEHCFEVCPRQCLHARTLGFRHPRTGEEMDFEAPLPPDMTEVINLWRGVNRS